MEQRLNAAWRKSTYSGQAGAVNCVEAGSVPGLVLVRDTAESGNGPVLRVTSDDWARFTMSVRG